MSDQQMWSIGDPCPYCGNRIPHDITFFLGQISCEPTEENKSLAKWAWQEYHGLLQAKLLDYDPVKIEARMAELQEAMDKGQPLIHRSSDSK